MEPEVEEVEFEEGVEVEINDHLNRNDPDLIANLMNLIATIIFI